MRMRRHHAKVIGRDGESGHFLVEAAIGLVIFTIALLSAMQFLRWNMDPLLMQERQDKAAKQAESVLNELAARKNSNLPDGGSFAVGAQGDPTRNADNTVTLNCSTAYCDQIVAAPQAAGTAYYFTRADWGAAAPADGMQVYVRATASTAAHSLTRLPSPNSARSPARSSTRPSSKPSPKCRPPTGPPSEVTAVTTNSSRRSPEAA
jgi:type II secretory pathway pseudopilin PulG